MPFGVRNAPITFQRALDIILRRGRWQMFLMYLDDVIIFSKDAQTYLRHVEEVLRLLRKMGVTLKLRKRAFFQPKVDYLGHVITPGKLSVAVHNSKAFAKAVFPRTVTQLRSLLGAANKYRRFVQKYWDITLPLNYISRKDAESDCENPTKEQKKAFETLKTQLISPPILALLKAASTYQLGATLLQQQDENKLNDWVPTKYGPKTLKDT